MTTQVGSSLNTTDEAVAALRAKRTPEPVEPTGETDDSETVETEEVEAVAETESEDSESYELDDSEGEELAEDDLGESEAQQYTLKVGGETLELTEDELLENASKGLDYTKKTMALAEERKAFEAEKQTALQKLAETQQKLESLINEQSEPIDWDYLEEHDPAEHYRLKMREEKRQKALKDAQEAGQADYQKKLEAYRSEQDKKLAEVMGWKEQKQVESDMTKAGEYLAKLGVSSDEIGQLVDHRLWKAIIDASKFNDSVAKVEIAKKEVKKAPKSVKSGLKPKPNDTELEAARKRLQSSGGRDESAAVALLRAKRGN